MNKRGVLALSMAAMMLFSAVGCSSSSDEGSKSEGASDLPKIGATIYKYDDNFMSAVRRELESNAKDKAELIINDSQNDQAKQLEQIDTMIAKGVKVLAINLVDPKAATTVIEKAKAAELPVIFFNKEPDKAAMESYDKAYYVGTDSKESGVIQGEVMAKQWDANKEKWDKNGDGKIQYVMIKGEPGHPDAEARTEYSIKTLNEKGIETEELAVDTAMWDAAKATEKMDAWLAKFGDKIEFVICNNDGMASGAVASLEKEGYFSGDKFMPVVGVDAIPEIITLIESDKVIGTVLNDAVNQGKAVIDLSVNAASGKDVVEGTDWKLNDKVLRVPYVGITKENIGDAK
ncbi:galactose/glucose ABC transporter substrate-binding protein MglB [Clostridium sp. CCUG 7971]|uniref:galactose/glucose ABC transporter substrate-binding protein MglB n=1 Tax=Clostridium sp. CCUG 7971 TaxID=2811414 RepID=UPI001ABB8992|nr:galactose/glucose ABC transporter substrate-binding protein MglB [Clostridium sp. CCUG 7971]MBO3445198.1 galactose/glucose ABC transporter substrate-binding protein MglB [Clostridium sp. CCUG 7971]